MIEVKNLTKTFNNITALNDLTLTVQKGSIYGLVGANGAGKTTIIKHLVGVMRPNTGFVAIDGNKVYDNTLVKRRLALIPDDLYFIPGYNINDMARLYKGLYPTFDSERYALMLNAFGLDTKRKLSRFSKGMQKQAAFILALSTNPEYLILDEPIDGLDPVIRLLVWKYIEEDKKHRQMTVLVSSHNLRELEGRCDTLGIIAKGQMVSERALSELTSGIHKIQTAFGKDNPPESPYQGLDILHKDTRGSVDLLIIKGNKDDIDTVINANTPIIYDYLPLTLEESYMYEGEAHE